MGRSHRVGLSGLLALSVLPNASAASISTSGEITLNTVAPLLLALFIAYFVRRWFIPQQLKNLQVAFEICLLYTSPSPRDRVRSRMPSSA